MKRLIFVSAFCAAMALAGLPAQQASPESAVAEMSFSFSRQSGAGTNQFAVWVEDGEGKHVKTLYATQFTANGGWRRRANSIPLWVRKSGISGLNKPQIDVISGATPRNGMATYRWDGTDSKGAALPAGSYVICLEGTLRWDKHAVYRAPLRFGEGAAAVEVSVVYLGEPTASERTMLSNVTARTLR